MPNATRKLAVKSLRKFDATEAKRLNLCSTLLARVVEQVEFPLDGLDVRPFLNGQKRFHGSFLYGGGRGHRGFWLFPCLWGISSS